MPGTPLKVLVVAPHPDDAELGMGGTIARLVHAGHDVMIVDATDGEPTPHGSRELRAKETARATEILGVKRRNLDLPNRTVVHSVEARHRLAGAIREHRAEVIFAPYFEDAHPDHRAVTRIAEDARFDAKLTRIDLPGEPIYPKWFFHYYATHLRTVPRPSFIVDITGFEARKRDAVLAYESQFVTNVGNRRVVEWLEAAQGYFGSRIGTAAGEPFFSQEPLGLAGLGGLA